MRKSRFKGEFEVKQRDKDGWYWYEDTEMTLKEKLQAGPGSRELSDEFLLAMGWYRISDSHDFLMPPGGYKVSRQPNPTLNIDDALNHLVPDGWIYILAKHPDKFKAVLDQPKKLNAKIGEAPTLPLAICAAILEIE